MGATQSKHSNNSTPAGKLRSKARSRKRNSKLVNSFRWKNNKVPKPDSSPSNASQLPPIRPPSVPPSPTSQHEASEQQQQHNHSISPPLSNDNVTGTPATPPAPLPPSILSTPPMSPLDNIDNGSNKKLHTEDDVDEDELPPLTPIMRSRSTNTNNNDNIKKRPRNSTRSTSTATRPVSTLSFSTDSGLQSASSSSWTFSGGLFSQIDANTSSTITAVTDYSTISKKSVLDLPDEHSNKRRTLPPPYRQQSNSEPSSSTTTTDTTATGNTPATDLSLALTGGDNTLSDSTTALEVDSAAATIGEPGQDTSSFLLTIFLTQLAKTPTSSFRLFKDAFTTGSISTSCDKDGDQVVSKDTLFKAAEVWYQKTNDTVAQVWLTRCTIEGWGTTADPKLGLTRLKALADHGCWEAYYPLAHYYLKGITTTTTATTTDDATFIQQVDHKAAYQWFLATVESQLPYCATAQDQNAISEVIALSQYRLGSILFYGLDVAEQPEQGFHWFEKSAALGNRYSQFIVGLHYEKGTIVKQDLDKAKEYYQSSADQGFVDAQAALGICLVEQDQTQQGIVWLKRAITMNNTRALLKFGMMHETGQGIPKDQEKALHYYKVAAYQDDPVAHYVLGVHYRLGEGLLEQDHQLAAKHLIRSARAGFAPSQRLIGLMYASGLLSTPPMDREDEVGGGGGHYQRRLGEKTALVWFRRAASHGDVRALGLVGYCYEFGHGAAVNHDIALQYYQKAARIASPFQCSAQVAVATLLHRMNRHHDALDWYTRAAMYDMPSAVTDNDGGNIILKDMDEAQRMATLMVARYRLHGWTGTKDPASAFYLLSQLTCNNTTDAHSHYWMAACYEEGITNVCDCDLGKAYHHYYLAASIGDSDAQFQVAFMLSNGKGVEKNRSEAFQWYEKAATHGHKTALYSMGLYYVKGLEGVDKDLKKACECFEKAAQLGMITAMTSLASLYRMRLTNSEETHNSQGNDDDLATTISDTATYYRDQIVYWYRKAAALNDAGAQRELGILYNAGLFGITQDHAMALELLAKASRQEDAQATLLLASYYQNGTLVEKDDDQAIRLYLFAISLGSPIAHFAVAQLYHTLHQYENAYTQYKLAADHQQLQRTRIGRTAKLMVARYVLCYIGDSSSDIDTADLVIEYTKENAFKMLENLAVMDRFKSSFYWLADCYLMGNGTEINYHDALYWFRRSADETKDKDSMFKVAYMFEKGLGSDVNLSMALQYNEQCANDGHAEGQHKMGMAFWRGQYNLEIDLNKSVEWFTKSATQRYNQSHWALGQLAIENGDQEMAVAWWQKAIDLGHVLSMRLLATLFLQQPSSSSSSSNDTPLDLGRALQLLADASRLGDTESLVLLGQVHQAGMVTSSLQFHSTDNLLPKLQQSEIQCSADDISHGGVSGGSSIINSDGDEEMEMNDEETRLLQRQQEEQELATRCFEQAACQGHVGAMFLAAQSWHTQQQYAAAFEFYDQAAQCGHTLSRVMRARYQLAGLGGIPIQKELGFQELLICAEQEKCAEAYNSLGQCYESGLGTTQNAVSAYQWYLKSSETTKDAEAMYRIGQLYSEDRLECAEPKEEAAVRWYQLADDTAGHPQANYQLGLYYIKCQNAQQTQPHYANAMKHLRKAAMQDDKDAMYELGHFYLSDTEEPNLDHGSSKVEWQMDGVHWITRAAHHGSPQAQCELATLYHSGRDVNQHVVVEQDFEKAYDLFCQAARQGDVTATVYIGTYYEHGIHVAPSMELAKEWYQEAIAQAPLSSTGNNDMLWLAELGLARLWHQEKASIDVYNMFCSAYQHGPPLMDQQTTMKSSSSSSYSTMLLCKVMIIRYELYGWGGVTKDCALAAQELMRMAEQGHSKVFLDIAQCYEEGIGLELDYVNAYTWYGRIVSLSNSLATTEKTTDEENGDNGDDELWDEEDEQDQAVALFKLAEFYRLGFTPNGQVDLDKANSLYHLAADKGSEEALQYIHSFST
ncbi:unnamed protein product [Absidia cylindrospora]